MKKTYCQKRYLEWLVLPAEQRIPATEAELAQELERQPTTLLRWRRLPAFQQALNQAIRWRLLDRSAAIYEIIGRQAEHGDFRFIKLALEILGHYPPAKGFGSGSAGEIHPSINLNTYLEVIERISAWKRDQYGSQEDPIENLEFPQGESAPLA